LGFKFEIFKNLSLSLESAISIEKSIEFPTFRKRVHDEIFSKKKLKILVKFSRKKIRT
jgi:hypothetical protein